MTADPGGPRPVATRTDPKAGALDGLLVVSLEQAVAAPFATRQLADLGARVIKVERSDGGDFSRGYDGTVRGLSSHFLWLNRSKESVVLDLKSAPGMAALEELLRRADVFVQNLGPGATDRLGIGRDRIRRDFPHLVTCSISGYGSGGPWSHRKAYDALIQSETGLISATGTAAEGVKVGIPVADIAAGMYAYSGVLAALLRRANGGGGAWIEVCLLDALAEWMSQPAMATRYSGRPPARYGAHHTSIVPYGPFATADGRTVHIAVQNEREWARLCCDVLLLPGLASEARFASNILRAEQRVEVSAIVAERLAALPYDAVTAALDKAGIAYAAAATLLEFLEHSQLSARDRWIEVDTPAGPVTTLAPPLVSAELPVRIGAVPALGADTEAVLAELGLAGEFSHPPSTEREAVGRA